MEEKLAATTALTGSVTGLIASLFGAILSPVIYGWMFALGTHIQQNKAILAAQQQLLEEKVKED